LNLVDKIILIYVLNSKQNSFHICILDII